MRVEGSVADKVIERAVILAGARARDDVDLASTGAAHVRRIAGSLHLEFLHRVRRGTEVLRVKGRVGVDRAIQQKVIGVGAIAANRDGGALPRTPVQRVCFTRLCSKSQVCSRYRQHKVHQHPTVERQVGDRLRFNHLTNTRVRGLHQVGSGGNFDRLLGRTYLQRKIRGELLPYFHFEGSSRRRKSCGFNTHSVFTREQAGNLKDACAVRLRGSLEGSRGRGYADWGRWSRMLLRIGDRAANRRIVTLRNACHAGEKQEYPQTMLHRSPKYQAGPACRTPNAFGNASTTQMWRLEIAGAAVAIIRSDYSLGIRPRSSAQFGDRGPQIPASP